MKLRKRKPFRLSVKWGRAFSDRRRYSFATKAERDAFLYGAEQSSGWEDFAFTTRDDVEDS